jgi:hypothetical protein
MEAINGRYALVDWNTSFHAQHTNAFPDASPARIWVSTGRIAYDLLLTTGGTAYLPRQMIESALELGRLHSERAFPPRGAGNPTRALKHQQLALPQAAATTLSLPTTAIKTDANSRCHSL